MNGVARCPRAGSGDESRASDRAAAQGRRIETPSFIHSERLVARPEPEHHPSARRSPDGCRRLVQPDARGPRAECRCNARPTRVLARTARAPRSAARCSPLAGEKNTAMESSSVMSWNRCSARAGTYTTEPASTARSSPATEIRPRPRSTQVDLVLTVRPLWSVAPAASIVEPERSTTACVGTPGRARRARGGATRRPRSRTLPSASRRHQARLGRRASPQPATPDAAGVPRAPW